MKLRLFLKRIFVTLVLLFVLVGLLNWTFFWMNLSFTFRGPEPVPHTSQGAAEVYEPNFLQIPSLGIGSPVQYPDRVTEHFFQEALAGGVAHYPGTALPGQSGNMYVFGHSSDLPWAKGDYKTVFALLPRIEVGATIYLTNSTGQRYTYVVREAGVRSARYTEALSQGEYKEKLLTLQTSYPVGTALRRYVVVAELK